MRRDRDGEAHELALDLGIEARERYCERVEGRAEACDSPVELREACVDLLAGGREPCGARFVVARLALCPVAVLLVGRSTSAPEHRALDGRQRP